MKTPIQVNVLLPFLITSNLITALQLPPSYAISPSPDGHFFQDSLNNPFFWQADTGWLLFHRLNYSESETYLSDRASKGFNMVLAVGFTQIGITSPNRNGDLTFVDEDVTQPNEPYWAYIDSIVELAWTKGVRIAMVPAWGYYVHSDQNVGSYFNVTTAQIFGNFIGNRYPYLPKSLFADTNPWWENKTAVKADYASGGVTPKYSHIDWSPIYDALAEGIVEGELVVVSQSTRKSSSVWKPLITIHPTNQWFNGGPLALASAMLGDRDWLTFDSSQTGHSDYPPNAPIPWWNSRRGYEPIEIMYATAPARPALDNEAHYENRYDNGKIVNNITWSARDVRVGSWQAAFSGAAGVTYGADNVMQFYNPSLYSQDGSGPAIPWYTDINLPGSSQIQYIQKALLDRTNYFSRVPAQDIIVSHAGSNDDRVTATRDSEGKWIMVYTPTGDAFKIETGGLVGCEVVGSWFDTVEGVYEEFEYEQCGGNGTAREFVPPRMVENADWVLVLETT